MEQRKQRVQGQKQTRGVKIIEGEVRKCRSHDGKPPPLPEEVVAIGGAERQGGGAKLKKKGKDGDKDEDSLRGRYRKDNGKFHP